MELDELEKEIIKKTLLHLCAEHKNTCDDPECTIQIFLMKRVFDVLEIELTKDEIFMLM